MNIFFLDADPQKAAEYLDDKRVVKMVTETAQILSSAAHLLGQTGIYRPTHLHHPSVRWTALNRDNWDWLLLYGIHLSNEYTRRYHKRHKAGDVILLYATDYAVYGPSTEQTQLNLAAVPMVIMEPVHQAVPEQFKSVDPVAAYRQYFADRKTVYVSGRSASWKTRGRPAWLT